MNEQDLIKAARDRLDDAKEADRENRLNALDDLRHLVGEGQWPEEVRTEREQEGRPCLTINRLPQFLRQVTGDIRRLNPAISVVPGDDGASDDVAEIYEGLIRRIEYRSGADSVYEAAAESAAACGMGYFRVMADWEDETSFNQEILIKRVPNPFAVYFDPMARESHRSDAEYVFVTEAMTVEDFNERYPDKKVVDVNADGETEEIQNWVDGQRVIVAEYMWKEYDEVTIAVLANGMIVEDPGKELPVIRKRTVRRARVMWAKITGQEVLEGPTELPCKHLPVIAVMGEELPVDEGVYRSSVIRHAKDPQRLYNYWRSAQTELIALQPKAPYIITAKQVAGFESFWNEANSKNRPYLPYNPDEKAGGPPKRETPPVASSGMMNEIMIAAEDMKATTGIYDAGLGNQSTERSGVAIRQRQMESDISTSIYTDNLARAIEQAGRVIVSMIPRVYDTPRMLRIVGKDGSQKQVEANVVQETIDGQSVINDLTAGKYDVRVTVGPNYTTRRQETAQSMMEFVKSFPPAAAAVMDLVAANMDWPGADQMADRLKKMLPPGVRNVEDMTPEEQQAMQQQMQQQQAAGQIEFQKAQAEATEATADAEKAKVEAATAALELAIANGQMNAVINQAVNAAVARALQGAMPAMQAPQRVNPVF